MTNEQVSKAEMVRNLYDDGMTVYEIAEETGLPIEKVQMVVEKHDADYRAAECDDFGDDFPLYMEYDDWKYEAYEPQE